MLQERERIRALLEFPLVLPVNDLQETIDLERHCSCLAFPGSEIHSRKSDELLHCHGHGGDTTEKIHLGDVAASHVSSVFDVYFERDCVAFRECVLAPGVEIFVSESRVRAVPKKIRLLIRMLRDETTHSPYPKLYWKRRHSKSR